MIPSNLQVHRELRYICTTQSDHFVDACEKRWYITFRCQASSSFIKQISRTRTSSIHSSLATVKAKGSIAFLTQQWPLVSYGDYKHFHIHCYTQRDWVNSGLISNRRMSETLRVAGSRARAPKWLSSVLIVSQLRSEIQLMNINEGEVECWSGPKRQQTLLTLNDMPTVSQVLWIFTCIFSQWLEKNIPLIISGCQVIHESRWCHIHILLFSVCFTGLFLSTR